MDLAKAKTSTIFFKYVIPQMFGLVINSIYFIIDGIFIGRRLGTNALAAAGVAVPVIEIIISLSMMVAIGTGVIVSTAAGRGERETARHAFNVSIRFTLLLTIVIAIAGNFFIRPLSYALGANDAIISETVTYLRIFITFTPFVVFSYALTTFVRNDGKPGLAMCALIIGSVLNVILDYVFMYPLNMGIAGAALATGIGPVASVCIVLPHFLRKKGMLYITKTRMELKTIGTILVRGLPAFVAEFSVGIITLLYNIAIVHYGLGEDGLASYVVIGYAALIGTTAFLGASEGIQPAVSFYVGSQQPDKIRSLFRVSSAFNFGIGLLLYLVLFCFGRPVYGVFIQDAAALLEFTHQSARVYFLNLPFAAINMMFVSFLQAMGHVRPSLLLSLMRTTLPLIVFLVVLPMLLPTAGLWLAAACAEVVTLVCSFIVWKKTWAAPDVLPTQPERLPDGL